jgi:hypothetical protein
VQPVPHELIHPQRLLFQKNLLESDQKDTKKGSSKTLLLVWIQYLMQKQKLLKSKPCGIRQKKQQNVRLSSHRSKTVKGCRDCSSKYKAASASAAVVCATAKLLLLFLLW